MHRAVLGATCFGRTGRLDARGHQRPAAHSAGVPGATRGVGLSHAARNRHADGHLNRRGGNKARFATAPRDHLTRPSRNEHGLPFMKRTGLLALAFVACAASHDASAPARTGTAPAPAVEAPPPSKDAGVVEDAPCARDGDCALTRVAQGACCPMLCHPRVVTRERAAELTANTVACTGGKRESCPQPLCRPTAVSVQPSCQGGRCVARTTSAPPD